MPSPRVGEGGRMSRASQDYVFQVTKEKKDFTTPVTWAVTGTLVLVVCTGFCLQQNVRLRSEVAVLQQQLHAIRSPSLQLPGEVALPVWRQWWEWLTVRRGCVEDAVDGECNSSTHAELLLRAIAGYVAVGTLLAAWALMYRTDQLPSAISRRLRNLLDVQHEEAEVPLSKLVAYRVEVWLSTHPYSKTLSLLYLTLALIYLGGLAIYAVSGESIYDAFWQAIAGVGIDWTFADDAVEGRGLSAFTVRLMAVAVSVGGMLITALMLGIVSDAISDRIEDMRKGKAEVLEHSHTLILGWSEKVASIVDQICQANASEGGKPIVIMSEREKAAMEAELADHQIDMRGSTVTCRTGNPLLSADLGRVSISQARSILVLATADAPDQSDARVLRVILALMAMHNRLKQTTRQGLKGHIVAEVCDLDNEELVRMVGIHGVHTLVSHDIIGRLMIQSARQPGLAMVWEQLMGFTGDEFYLKEWPQLVGSSFRNVLVQFPAAVPLGVMVAHTGQIMLNPPDDYQIDEGDQILVLAEDDDTYEPAARPALSEPGPMPLSRARQAQERILFCGWRRDMDDMIVVMDAFVAPGSELWLYSAVPLEERQAMLEEGGLDIGQLQNLRLRFQEPQLVGDLVNRKRLEELKPERFSSILILADHSTEAKGGPASITDSDSRSLATLLLLRDIQTKRMGALTPADSLRRATSGAMWYDNMQSACSQTVIISEILDSRTRHLIQDLHVSEFVLSNELVSMALAMVAESPEVNTILAELFTEQGNELYVHPASRYLRDGECLSFYDVMLRAREFNEVVFGYRNVGMRAPVLNPKNKADRVLSLEATTSFVCLAEDDEGMANKLGAESISETAASQLGAPADEDGLGPLPLKPRHLGISNHSVRELAPAVDFGELKSLLARPKPPASSFGENIGKLQTGSL